MDTVDFCRKFTELQGDLISERREYLFRLIRTPSLFTSEAQLKSALQNLKPATYQQHLFYIDTLIYFRRIDELLEIFLQGNVIYTNRIFKQSWFLELILKDKEVHCFVNEFLPLVPYSIKCRLIVTASKLWNQEKNDALFDAVYIRYGLTLAVPILHHCSLPKVEFQIKENDLRLRSKQILQLYERDENFLQLYLNHHKRLRNNAYNEKRVVRCLLRKNPTLFLKIIKEDIIKTPYLGKSCSKRLLKSVREDLFLNVKFYLTFVKKSVVMWRLRADLKFEKLYEQTFATSFTEISNNPSNSLLKYYPKSRHWNLFLQTCNEKFPDKNLEDILLALDNVEQLHPPRDLVWKWAELNYEKHMGYKWAYQKFLGYFEPSKAIVLIKEKINLTSEISERCLLVDLMLKSCQRSNNLTVLEEVLKYICFRHRNEDFEFRNTILHKIRLYFDPQQFNGNHWKCIDEIIQIMRIQKEYSYADHPDLQEEYIEFLFLSGKDYKKDLMDYIYDNQSHYIHLTLKNISVQKRIYTAVLNILPEVTCEDPFVYKKMKFNYLNMVKNFSMRHPEHCINISDFPVYMDTIESVVSKVNNFDIYDRSLLLLTIQYNYKFPDNTVWLNVDIVELIMKMISDAAHMCGFDVLFEEFLCKKHRTQFEHDLLELYFSCLINNYMNGYVVNWFIMNEPKFLVPYFRKIAYKSISTVFLKHLDVIKHYSHLGFDEILCRIYKEQLDNDDVVNHKRLLENLQLLLPTSDFLELVKEKYIPQQDKFTETEQKIVLYINYLRCDAARLLVSVTEPDKAIPIALQFCRGDYLRSGIRSLYSSFYKTAEQTLYPYIEAVSRLSVPIRKHAIFLSCALMNKECVLNVLEVAKETDISVQKNHFSASLKFFLKHPSQKYLDEILKEIGGANGLDRKLVYTLVKVKMPLKYRTVYLENSWKFVEGLREAWTLNITKYLGKILRQVHTDMLRSFSDSFIVHVVKSYFTITEQNRPDNFDTFLVQLLKHRPENRTLILDVIFSNQSNIPNLSQIHFFKILCKYIRKKDIDTQLINSVRQYWNNFSVLGSFDQHVPLKLIALQIDSSTTAEFAIGVIDYLEQLMSEFGPSIYWIFEQHIHFICINMNDEEILSFCSEAIHYKISATVCILIMNLIKNIKTEKKKLIMTELKNIEIPIVQIYLNQPLTH
ncbi:uncharacterized protein LOC114342577 [Diabrotica virgifera virgifera]|uniref:Kinetochore-associated protein 1-like n=1 Tax=Diabrotica virgifera virgifera TaxID=50390 RepID=A0ABM5IYD1_DIAVI|nr:uncharacterized protein LOC114342577 [Diabrotica virgifera virgifera]XP_028149204.2 uncharacterized protein LOC114342577 [Diabrotica virgifera virgifera]